MVSTDEDMFFSFCNKERVVILNKLIIHEKNSLN